MLKTEVVTETAAFARLAPAWRALEQSTGMLGPFVGYSWQLEWWRALGGGRHLRIIVAREGADIVGILPLFEERAGAVRRLAFIGSGGGGADYLDALCSDAGVRRCLIDATLHLGADVLELAEVESRSPLLNEIRGEVLPRFPCPFISVRGTFAEYSATVARGDTLRRRTKWFKSQPGFRITCETNVDAVAPFLARFFRLHTARWLADGGTQAFSDARLVGFHRAIGVRFAEEGRLRLWTLWVAGEAVAVAYAFDDAGRSLYYQSGFLPAWGARSAGLVLFARFVEDAFERGLKEVDLLHGAEPYKSEWTKEARATVTLRKALTSAGHAALAAQSAWARARTVARTALPQPLRLRVSQAVRGARLRGAAG